MEAGGVAQRVAVAEHQAVFDAVMAGDRRRTLEALINHLTRSRENTLRQVRMLATQAALP